MEHKTNKTISRIAAAMLALAVVLAGITLDGTAAAHAASRKQIEKYKEQIKTYKRLKDGDIINMKVGEKKRFLVTEFRDDPKPDEYDIVPDKKWFTSDSDAEIIDVDTDFVNPYVSIVNCVEVYAKKPGTATIIGRGKMEYFKDQYNGTDRSLASYDTDMKITVNVTKQEKATAAQKKCSHSWKITTKSTCQHKGVKTCRKCGLQKMVKKAPHKYAEVATFGHEVLDVVFEVYCDDGCSLDTTVRLSDYAAADEIKNAHYVESSNGTGGIKWELTGVSDSISRKFAEAVNEAMEKHSHVIGNWFFGGSDVLSDGMVTTGFVEECLICGARKQQ